MTTVQILYEKSFLSGRKVQIEEQSGEKVDGRAVWNELESTIGKLLDIPLTNHSEILKYNQNLIIKYREMNDIIREFGMDTSEFNPKSNHFFCQLMNLVDKKSNFVIKLNKIMQIGFNAGQLSVFLERKTLPVDRIEIISNFIRTNNMLDLNTYVTQENQEIINNIYLHEFKGGKYRSRSFNKRVHKSHRFSRKRKNRTYYL